MDQKGLLRQRFNYLYYNGPLMVKLILSGYNILFTDFLQIFLVFLNNYYGIFFIIGNDFLMPYN